MNRKRLIEDRDARLERQSTPFLWRSYVYYKRPLLALYSHVTGHLRVRL